MLSASRTSAPAASNTLDTIMIPALVLLDLISVTKDRGQEERRPAILESSGVNFRPSASEVLAKEVQVQYTPCT